MPNNIRETQFIQPRIGIYDKDARMELQKAMQARSRRERILRLKKRQEAKLKSIKAKHIERLQFRMLFSRRIKLGILKDKVYGYDKTELDNDKPFESYGCYLTQQQLFGSKNFEYLALNKLNCNSHEKVEAIIDEACNSQDQHFEQQMERIGNPEYFCLYKQGVC